MIKFFENRLVYENPPKAPSEFKLDGSEKVISPKKILEKPKSSPDMKKKRGSITAEAAPSLEISDNTPSFDSFMARLDIKDESKDKFSKWAEENKDPEQLRRGNMDALTNVKDGLEKHVRLSSEYLQKMPNENGNFVFSVNFKGNEVAEWKIGAGHLLPPVVKDVKISDGGNVVCENAVRGIKNGRVGYFNVTTGEYVAIHSGYKIEVLKVQEPTNEEASSRIKEENELFDKDSKKLVIKENLEKFFRNKNLDVKVDDNYFVRGIGDILTKLDSSDPSWWEKFLEGKFGDAEFNLTFEQSFSAEDISFMQNLCRLRQLQESWRINKKDDSKHEGETDKQREEREEMERLLEKSADTVMMSDLDRLRKDRRFDELKKPELSDDELYNFAQKEEFKNGGTYSGLVESEYENSKEVSSNEQFVNDKDDFGNVFYLRASAMKAFKRAMEIANANVPHIRLKITSSHRGIANQEGIFANALKKYGSPEAARKWAALPGSSPHHTGGAIDVAAYLDDGSGGVKHANQQYLKTILPRAGFVNYDAEPWHWEIYTKRWKRITGDTSSPLYANRLDGMKKTDSVAYSDYVTRESAAA